ncbi:unnamed protein product [Didymodactylos carnosus]|uniref:Uncharacterized protein n=1 Tax=Didymodactylos carnosus TaxID=1234261 RepID=A0A814IM46_9BILA|nr:unnamed protein product [Didymodactylos carnosus]CAF1024572.1 unnamed protein product [Didymodactylos carnosus]CAF3693968.1 unnamed protein product [Didymodactylos carnosus]CAF3795826.1 unnamed protein product [Didymodactylos carnosus]
MLTRSGPMVSFDRPARFVEKVLRVRSGRIRQGWAEPGGSFRGLQHTNKNMYDSSCRPQTLNEFLSFSR